MKETKLSKREKYIKAIIRKLGLFYHFFKLEFIRSYLKIIVQLIIVLNF